MNSSPPKASSSSRPPAALGAADGGRRITALAAGGSVLLLSLAAVGLWPRTYGTEATFVVEGQVASPPALAGRVEATLLERDELARVAIELPPELRSPDPIGRLRAGIHVQSRGPLGYVVEFRGSEPKSVQRIANLLADRAVALVPKLAATPQDQGPAQALAARTRAVTEFLTAHPEVTLEAPSGGKSATTNESGLEALRAEKRQLEQRLTTGATDNPYADPEQSPDLLNRRVAELKNTIARREKALKGQEPASPPAVSPELVAQWRKLLAELATAQAAATQPAAVLPPVTARVTARAPLPSSPLTPNRLVLGIVALLLSAAAALVAYVLPRKAAPVRRGGPRSTRVATSDPPNALAPGVARSEPLRPRSEPPIPRSDPPPPPGPPRASEPPGPIAVQRTVVLGPSGSGSSPPAAAPPNRSHTAPGGLEAPARAATNAGPPPATAPGAPLFGSRPPPGAGSYSVSSSHPPPMDSRGGSGRTSVERLSPLQSAHPPSAPTSPVVAPPAAPLPTSRPAATSGSQQAAAPQIVSRPPALDPEAESWAAHFESLPPAAEPTRPTHPQPTPLDAETEAPRKRGGRWKTQAMGSMVPIEVMASRDELPPPSDTVESVRPRPMARQVPGPAATTVVHHDVPTGWAPQVNSKSADVTQLRDAVLQAATGIRITLLVTGTARGERAQVASGLGVALADAGARTLLIEADFDSPELHRALSLNPPPGAGFTQQLMARRNARHPEPLMVMRCSSNLSVLPEGRFRSPGLVLSREFEAALLDLTEQHHIVVIHAPSLARPDDLRPLGAFAQGVVVVEPNQPSQLRLGDNPLRALV